MAKKKPGVVEKIANAVDHVLHPEHSEPAAEVAAAPAPAVEASCADQDYQKHPKFDKFKTLEGEN